MSAEFIESTHDKIKLCYPGYQYCFKHKNQNGSHYWVCVQCKATASSYSDLSVKVRDAHAHSPDETDKKVLEIRKNLKRKAAEQSGPKDTLTFCSDKTLAVAMILTHAILFTQLINGK